MADLLLQAIEAGYAGLNSDDSQAMLPPGEAPVHENFVVHHQGKMLQRGPILNHANLTVSTAANEIIAGAWAWNNMLLVSFVAPSATATREPWTAPYRKAAAASDLALARTSARWVNLDTLAAPTSVVVTANNAPGGRGARLGAYTYGFAYSSTVAAVNENGGFLFKRPFLRWDGTATAPTVYTNAPEGGQDVRTHLDRIFVLGGRSNHIGGVPTTIQQHTLYFSDQGGPTTDVATRWQDDATSALNQIVIDSDDGNDFGVALAKVGENLVIFKRKSIHVLYGYSASTFQVRTITTDMGCVDQRSIVEYAEGCYFLSDQGMMFFDGTRITNVNENLRSSLMVAVGLTVGDNGVDGGRAVATKLTNDYVILSVCKQTFSSGVQSADDSRFAGLLHTPTGRWSSFSSNATATLTPVFVGRTLLQPYLLDGTRLAKIDKLTAPEQAPEAQRGFDEVNSVKARIPSKWYSAVYPLAKPTHYSQLHRVFVDYAWQVDATADDADLGWYVTVVDGTGTVLMPETQVPSMGDPTGYVFRRRAVLDVFSEASEFQLRMEWKGSGTFPPIKRGEIFGGFAEFSRGRQSRSS